MRWRPPTSGGGSIADFIEGVAHQLDGDGARARELLESGARRAQGEAPIVAASCHAQLALLAVEADDWEDAAACADEARAALAAVPVTAAGHALVLAVGAAVSAHRGDVFEARRDADAAKRLLASARRLRSLVPGRGAGGARPRRDPPQRRATGRALLTRAARNLSHVGDAGTLGEWLHAAWECADAFAAGATGSGPALTNAELRVLRFLPSHLSFREIGARLHLSTNTVKTQALAVYRKLGVSCRSDAVARGRAIGLVDG